MTNPSSGGEHAPPPVQRDPLCGDQHGRAPSTALARRTAQCPRPLTAGVTGLASGLCYLSAIKLVGASTTATLNAAGPIFGLLRAVIFLGERQHAAASLVHSSRSSVSPSLFEGSLRHFAAMSDSTRRRYGPGPAGRHGIVPAFLPAKRRIDEIR